MLYLHGYEGTKYPNSVRMHLEARKNIPILQRSIMVFWRVRDTTACRRRGAGHLDYFRPFAYSGHRQEGDAGIVQLFPSKQVFVHRFSVVIVRIDEHTVEYGFLDLYASPPVGVSGLTIGHRPFLKKVMPFRIVKGTPQAYSPLAVCLYSKNICNV